MALFKGDVLIAGTNPSGGGGAGGGHIIEDSEGTELEQRPVLQFIGADVQDDDVDEVTKVITPSFRVIQGDIPDTNLVCLDGIPIGGIIPYGAPINTLSDDWLPCLGQAVSRTFYNELFDKYGTTYGAGDGSTTFNLPNYGGRVPVGLDENDTDFDTLGETLGEKRHTLITQEMPKHKHFNGYKFNDGSGSSWSYRVTYGVKEGNTDGISDGETGGGQSHNNIQPSIVANYIVKAKTSSHTITTSNVMTVYNESDTNTYSTNFLNTKLDGIKMDVLWSRPKGSFSAQTVQLNLSNYNLFLIDFNLYNGGSAYTTKVVSTKGIAYQLRDGFLYNNTYYSGYRNFTVTDSGVAFGTAYNDAKSADDSWYNPTKIIGIRLP